MGQYYYPLNLDTFEWLYSHDYNHNGLKLTEHFYIGNDFCGVIMKLLTKDNKWYKTRIIWNGDYSREVYEDENLHSFCYDEDDKEDDVKIKLFKKIIPIGVLGEDKEKGCLIVNHTKKEYVKISDCIGDTDGWVINPLPLLTALGNGGGGGDYHGSSMDLIGRWACDVISVEFDEKEFKDFVKITPNFKEGSEGEGNNEENEIKADEKIKEWLNSESVKKRLVIRSL